MRYSRVDSGEKYSKYVYVMNVQFLQLKFQFIKILIIGVKIADKPSHDAHSFILITLSDGKFHLSFLKDCCIQLVLTVFAIT